VTVIDASGAPVPGSTRDLGPADSEDDAECSPGPAGGRDVLLTPLPGTDRGRARVEVVVDGWRFELELEDARRAELRRRATRAHDATAASAPREIRAIIPGRVAAVRVAAGDVVAAGDTLLVIEAMKMQNELRAPRDATVERVAVAEGETLEAGDVLVVLS